jgi:hypothetical protein
MLSIVVRGKPHKLIEKELWDVLKFIEKELGLNRYKHLHVCLYFRNKSFMWGYTGWAIYMDDYIKPREFLIEIQENLSKKEIIRTIIHEFAHVKQWASEVMKDRGPRLWYDKSFKSESLANIPYRKLPWEIDAVATEKLLYEKYKKHLKGDDDINKLKGKRMSKTVSKTEKLLSVMSDGRGLTSAQIQRKVGYGSSSAVTGAIRSLRSQGNCIYRNETNAGKVTYRLGNPGRTIVRAAYEANGSDIFRG